MNFENPGPTPGIAGIARSTDQSVWHGGPYLAKPPVSTADPTSARSIQVEDLDRTIAKMVCPIAATHLSPRNAQPNLRHEFGLPLPYTTADIMPSFAFFADRCISGTQVKANTNHSNEAAIATCNKG